MLNLVSADFLRTINRRNNLTDFFNTAVLDQNGNFICSNFEACSASHPGSFFEGQLHHIGDYYDLKGYNDCERKEVDLRIMVVGQEYGGPPSRFSISARTSTISQVQHSKARGDRSSASIERSFRNPHMTGTTNALRILLGLGRIADCASEVIQLSNIPGSVSIFDAFSLVNFLLCSATNGNKRGCATNIMFSNCMNYFIESMQELEPTVIVWQGLSYWDRVKTAFNSVNQYPNYPIVEVYYNNKAGKQCRALVGLFKHPSAPSGWGNGPCDPYLINTVEPTLLKILNLL